MKSLKDVLAKLFSLGLITKEQEKESDYNLLKKIISDRDNNKKKLNELNRTNLELDSFLEIINDESIRQRYSNIELEKIYENILH